MTCPECKSKNLETTTIGSLTPGRDPNWYTCTQCGHKGKCQDLLDDCSTGEARWEDGSLYNSGNGG